MTEDEMFRASLVDKMFIPSLTASVNGRLMRNVSASVSYSITRGSYVNLGAGLTAKLGPFQLYLETDNLLACNYTNTQSANARFGINLLFGHKDHKKKKKAAEKEPLEVMIAPVPVKKDTVYKEVAPEVDPVAPIKEEKVVDTESDLIRAYYVIVGSFKSKQSVHHPHSYLPLRFYFKLFSEFIFPFSVTAIPSLLHFTILSCSTL
mgnify:CR=1 FL=1